jgi:hypothetical protein
MAGRRTARASCASFLARLSLWVVAGTGVVIASSKNAAVEDITRELPATAKIASTEYGDRPRRYQETASRLHTVDGDTA